MGRADMSFSVFSVFPGRLAVSPVEAGAAAFGWAAKTSRNRLLAGTYPFPVVMLAGVRVVRLADVEMVLAGASPLAAVPPPPQRKPGRPRKMMEVHHDAP